MSIPTIKRQTRDEHIDALTDTLTADTAELVRMAISRAINRGRLRDMCRTEWDDVAVLIASTEHSHEPFVPDAACARCLMEAEEQRILAALDRYTVMLGRRA